MGVKGLLPYVKDACRPCKISEFRGRTIAVDACCWLHKGAFSCADKLALGHQTDMYVSYFMKMVNALLSHHIKLILVFDGASLPAKRQTNENRKQKRELAKEKGRRLLADGDQKAAYEFFRQSTQITSEMIGSVIEACKNLKRSDVQWIVAPYEADAQLAYLSMNNYADVVLSEDSDLIIFGCRKIIFKFDQVAGSLYDMDRLPLVLENGVKKLDFTSFRRMCILSGCDYLDGLDRIGLGKAATFFKTVSDKSKSDIKQCLKRIPVVLNMRLILPKNFVEEFIMAENTFLYQLVYDPAKKQMIPLNPYPDGISADDLPYAGKMLDSKTATEIAIGLLCPQSKGRRVIAKDFDRMKEMAPIPKRRSPIKSPRKITSTSPRRSENMISKTAFQTEHVRTVTRSKASDKKTAIVESLSSTSSCTIAMYDSTINEQQQQQLTRSRYFMTSTPRCTTIETSSSDGEKSNDISKSETLSIERNCQVESIVDTYSTDVTQSARKRSIFEALVGGDMDSDESGFFESSPTNINCSPNFTTPKAKRFGQPTSQTRRPFFRQENGSPGLVLNSFNSLSKFRYGSASQD